MSNDNEFPGALLSAVARLELKIGEQTDRQASYLRNYMNARNAETPRRTRIHGTGVASAAGFVVIGFDNAPQQGRFWMVRKLLVGGASPGTTAAGRADLYISAADYRRYTTTAEMGPQDWTDFATALPCVADYSVGEFAINGTGNEKLFVVISGGTSGQQYSVNATIEDYMEAASSPEWVV